MAIQNLLKGKGAGTFKIEEGKSSVKDGGTIATGLNTVVSVVLTATAASGHYVVASVESISGGTVTVTLAGAADGTAPASITTATDVYVIAIGY